MAPIVDERLAALLPSASGPLERLHAAMRYSALAPGKRVRPALCLLSARAVGADEFVALDAACALELVHAFSLVHDDLPAIDDDALRRGRPTCHIEFGEAVAILAGDALFALAFEILASCDVSAERLVQAMACLTRAAGSNGLVGGETVDILSEGTKPDKDVVRFIHERKTGALISAACEIGGLIGGGTSDEVAALAKFGNEVGLAFQIADDVLNETATAEQLGKAAGSDRHREKATYPSAYGLEAARQLGIEAASRGMDALAALGSAGRPLADLARFFVERQS